MNIDERLYRLVERHEALARSVELMNHQQQKTDEQIAKVVALMDRLAQYRGKLSEQIGVDRRLTA